MSNESGTGKGVIRTGLQTLRGVATQQALVGSLAQEPPEVIGPAEEMRGVHHSRVVTEGEQIQMMKEWAAGASLADVEARYGVTRGYIREAMKRRFGSRELMLEALKSLILENAVGAQMIAQQKLHELNGAQAVFAGKLLVETMGNLTSQLANVPKTINFAEFKKLGDALKEVRSLVSRKPPAASP